MRVLLLAVLLAGCDGGPSAMATAGPQAERIASLWLLFLVVCSAVWLLVIGFLAYAVVHGRRRGKAGPPDAETTRRETKGVVAAVAVTALILFVFLIADFVTGRRLMSLATPGALEVQVTGHQWWWEIHYEASVPSRRLTTANELHIPVGRPVLLKLTSRDVIHSFWAPNLHGKRDLIPGYTTRLWIQADTPGVYRGKCAEFCGYQHAKMAFLVIAEPPEQFAAWYEQQLRPAPQPADSMTQRGEQVFLSLPCVMCHTIRGTPAGGKVGPELTHLGSRRTIAAGTLPNTRGHLGGWILDPQRIKPGVRMPPNEIGSEDLHALLTYLESLQ